MLLPVDGPCVNGLVKKSIPAAPMSRLKACPNSSSCTFPIKAQAEPSEAIPAMVLAADPPDTSRSGIISWYIFPAESASNSTIPPFGKFLSLKNLSPTLAMTSTMALPMPTTS